MDASSASLSGTVLSIDARPRVRNITDSVAMKGCTLKYWISTPEARNSGRVAMDQIISQVGNSPFSTQFRQPTPRPSAAAISAAIRIGPICNTAPVSVRLMIAVSRI